MDDPIAGDTELKGTAWLALPLQMYPNPHRPYSNLPNNIFTHLTTIVSAIPLVPNFEVLKHLKFQKSRPGTNDVGFSPLFFGTTKAKV